MKTSRVVAFFVLLLVHTPAWAGPEARIRGWAAGQNPRSVEVFDADGMPQGKIDLSAVKIAGRRPWDPALGLVQLPGPHWVESRTLDLVFCEATAEQSFRGQSVSGPKGAKTYGSGNPCDVK